MREIISGYPMKYKDIYTYKGIYDIYGAIHINMYIWEFLK